MDGAGAGGVTRESGECGASHVAIGDRERRNKRYLGYRGTRKRKYERTPCHVVGIRSQLIGGDSEEEKKCFEQLRLRISTANTSVRNYT